MIRKRGSKKGPELSAPGSKKGEAPPTGRSSFASRVKTRRRKAQAAAAGGATPVPRKHAGAPPVKPGKQPALLTREQRLAVARGRTHRPPAPDAQRPPPGPVVTGTTTKPGSALSPPTATKRSKAAQRSRELAPKPQREPDEGFVAVGRVQGPFGLKGELKVLSLTDNPDRFRPKAKLWAGTQPVTIAGTREAQGYVYLTLKGFGDRTSVEKFRHALLQVPEAELPELEEGEYYRFQLVGLNVADREGVVIGVLEEVIETGGTDVYRVRTPEGKDVLLAATSDVVLSIDLAARRMVVDPPPWA